MNFFKYIIINIIGTLLRGFPFPCKTELIKIGKPGKNSPVFITCNFYVTVEIVKRVLEKNSIDCYLLIANSRGINVWCSATGGHFTNHDVVSALKTSGIEKLINHRNAIFPQLAAAGIEAKAIKEKTGWDITWGPVYAEDIPDFIKNNFKKTSEMRNVKFPLMQRIEIGIMWAFPFSIVVAFIAFIFWREMLLPLILLTWILPFLIFTLFPLYSGLLNPRRRRSSFSRYTVIFEFTLIPLILEVIFISCLVLYSVLAGTFSLDFILRCGLASLVILLLVSIDLMGSTPVYKSGLHEDRLLKVIIDRKKCRGCGICKQVCPRNCYEIDKDRHVALMPGADRCVQCGACIVQCPLDALYFKSPKGEVIYPEVVRKFKLNLIGKRLVKGRNKK